MDLSMNVYVVSILNKLRVEYQDNNFFTRQSSIKDENKVMFMILQEDLRNKNL